MSSLVHNAPPTALPSERPSVRLRRSLVIQQRVIGAVMMRELHTRFGRDNIGYLWLVLEPLILSAGISLIHLVSGIKGAFGILPGPFYATGYITYIIFRNTVNRAVSLIESNRPLLYHKSVTLLDMSFARTLLDVVATAGAMLVVLSIETALGIAEVPQRPWLIVAGMLLMGWLALGVSCLVAAFTQFTNLTDRIVHPMTYLLMPFSGMFYVLDELPRPFARVAAIFPFTHIADLVRMGLSANFNSTYFSLSYVVIWCSVLTLLGLSTLRIARRRIHFD